jgi:hypothetical protein
MRSRYIIIGDVHGCLIELRALLERIGPRSDDTVVFVGDLVDKGPQSPAVVRWIRTFAEAYRVVLIEGNHEEKHRRWRHHTRQGSDIVHTMTGTAQIEATSKALNAADIAFLETGRLYFRIPEYDAFVVHGGVPPALDRLPDDPREIAGYSRKQRDVYMKMQRIRFVSPEGKILQLGHETIRDHYWATRYDGRFGTVYFGHQVFMRPEPGAFEYAIGLDFGAVHGGYLAAAILSEYGVSYVMEPARQTYSTAR